MPTRRPPRRRHGAAPVPLDLERALGGQRSESGPDGEWTVRTVRAGAKVYLCPGCSQQIPIGTEHVVAWPTDPLIGGGPDQRRHWHASCWTARGRRRPR